MWNILQMTETSLVAVVERCTGKIIKKQRESLLQNIIFQIPFRF